jgi:hypothetical protein
MRVRYSGQKRGSSMSPVAEQTKNRIKDLGNDQQIIGFIKDVKLQELTEEIDRLELEDYEKENPIGVFKGMIFSLPAALFCWWLVYKLFFS